MSLALSHNFRRRWNLVVLEWYIFESLKLQPPPVLAFIQIFRQHPCLFRLFYLNSPGECSSYIELTNGPKKKTKNQASSTTSSVKSDKAQSVFSRPSQHVFVVFGQTVSCKLVCPLTKILYIILCIIYIL